MKVRVTSHKPTSPTNAFRLLEDQEGNKKSSDRGDGDIGRLMGLRMLI